MIDAELREAIWQRADDRCEYCRLRQVHYALWSHQIEHIVPRKHNGTDTLENLAFACVRCNLGKSSNLTGIDSLTNEIVPLFHPRREEWHDHFRYEEANIQGVTPTGRVTVYVLNMNEDNRLRLRYRLLENHELD